VYRVQVGAYISQVNAEARVAKLREQGFDAYVIHTGGLYRVQVGAFAVRENAARMADRLRAAGYDALISP
jgi:N-acetylmuramoyl-L-alanine amidase